MKNIRVILEKQMKDTIKNKEILLQFLLFPIIAAVMENTVSIEGMPERFFVNLFSVMYVGMAPLVSMSSILSEEKEKNTLRMLMLSGVKSWEYLLGTGLTVFLCCMLGALSLGLTGHYSGRNLMLFLLVMAAGMVTSLVLGAAIGTFCKTQMMATSITIPAMMVFAFLPMLAMFNDPIRRIAGFSYTQQMSLWLTGLGGMGKYDPHLEILLVDLAAAGALFAAGYKRSGLS